MVSALSAWDCWWPRRWRYCCGRRKLQLRLESSAPKCDPMNRRKIKPKFAICITGSEPDLQLRKIYQVLPDEKAAKSKYLGIIDESGEDYLYPEQYFIPVELPSTVEKAVLLES